MNLLGTTALWPVTIRASSTTSYNDCARRWAAQNLRPQIEALGYTLRRPEPGIGAAVGGAVHRAAEHGWREMLTTGALAEVLPGPIPAEVVRVIDGDTLDVRALIWPGVVGQGLVRIRAIDTPELRGRCDAERDLAVRARDHLAGLLAGGTALLTDVGRDKFGRILAHVSAGGSDAGGSLVAEGLARAYDGGARGDWCP